MAGKDHSEMPHARCGVCAHEAHEVIDSLLASGEPLRRLAAQFGLSKTSLNRHANHAKRDKSRINTGNIQRIDEEISKLIRAQSRAKRKRDTAGALAIARELRNWFVLRTKAEIAAVGTSGIGKADEQQLSPGEAVALAQSVLEGALNDPAVRNWLVAMADRIGQAGTANAAQDSTE
jgi:hypothetical protein